MVLSKFIWTQGNKYKLSPSVKATSTNSHQATAVNVLLMLRRMKSSTLALVQTLKNMNFLASMHMVRRFSFWLIRTWPANDDYLLESTVRATVFHLKSSLLLFVQSYSQAHFFPKMSKSLPYVHSSVKLFILCLFS